MSGILGGGRAFGKEDTNPPTRWAPNATPEGAGLRPRREVAGKGGAGVRPIAVGPM